MCYSRRHARSHTWEIDAGRGSAQRLAAKGRDWALVSQTERPTLQARVYDSHPLEEGAGKRCSECEKDQHCNRFRGKTVGELPRDEVAERTPEGVAAILKGTVY